MDKLGRAGWAAVWFAGGFAVLAGLLALFPAVQALFGVLDGSRPPVIIKAGSLDLLTLKGDLPLIQPSATKPEYELPDSSNALRIIVVGFGGGVPDQQYDKIGSISIGLASGGFLRLKLEPGNHRLFFVADKNLNNNSHPDAVSVTSLTILYVDGTTALTRTGDALKFLIWVN